ncbi:MAG: sel1 repeat family protein [Candidatus Methanomethylophilaceae archaeon]|nr:sel1 repeat family protein [Candidatus Methanomethylophilaceae archaeon]
MFDDVLKFFRVPDLSQECTMFLMTSSFFMKDEYTEPLSDTMSWEEMYLYSYRLLADVSVPDGSRLVIKAHPNTKISPAGVSSGFVNAAYIPGYIPSDILKFVKMNIRLGVSPGSNSISTMDIPDKLTLPRSYFKYAEMIEQIPVLNALASYVGCNGINVSKYVPSELIGSFEKIFGGTEIRNGELIYYNSDAKYAVSKASKSHFVLRLGTIYDFDPDSIPAGEVIMIRRELIGRNSVFNPEPVFFLYTHEGISLKEFSFRSFRIHSNTVLSASWISVYELKTIDRNRDRTAYYASLGNTWALMSMSKRYYSGGKVPKDIPKAAEFMRRASEDPCSFKPRRELVKMLWKEGLDDALLYETLSSFPANSSFSMFYIGRMYRSGRYLEKNPSKAAEFLRIAYRRKVKGSAKELYDALIQIQTPESYAEAFAVAESSRDEDPDMLARLGSSIYYGRGTEENKAMGRELIEKAASSDSKWAQKLLSSL